MTITWCIDNLQMCTHVYPCISYMCKKVLTDHGDDQVKELHRVREDDKQLDKEIGYKNNEFDGYENDEPH